jgi:spore germination cell wall hydrolase CwlJ-like protein
MKDIILAAIMSTSPEAMECMAKNIYFESRNQSHLGQLAVAHTTINRVVDDRYPNDICAVVKQGVKNSDGSMKRHKCQFSWYCDGLTDNPKNIDLWYQAQVVAAEAIGLWSTYDVTEGSTHYHTDKVNPKWAKTLDEVVQIDDHIFYRWNQ